MGTDNTLYAIKDGLVSFETKRKKKFDGSQRIAKIVNVG
jgi:ribosomal protein L27